MTPAELIEALALRKVALFVRNGKLIADPPGQLLSGELAWAKDNRKQIIEHLDRLEQKSALTAHDLDHPPAFDGSDAPRVLLSWPDHPGFLVLTADRLEAILAWNQGADERARKAAGRATRRKPAKAVGKDREQLEIGRTDSGATVNLERR